MSGLPALRARPDIAIGIPGPPPEVLITDCLAPWPERPDPEVHTWRHSR
ncbi:hypothetical protein ACTMTI_02640 [Nonomuraea sp. H19]